MRCDIGPFSSSECVVGDAVTPHFGSAIEKRVYAARTDGICFHLWQVLADEVAQNMSGRHFQKELTA
jgi:hypothetical protein